MVLGAAEQLERQTRARVIGIMNVNFFRSLILSSMSLPRCGGYSATSASPPSLPALLPPAGRPPGMTRPLRPPPTGTPWRNRHPNMSSTRKCSGSLLPASIRRRHRPATRRCLHPVPGKPPLTPTRPPPRRLPRPRPSPPAPSRGLPGLATPLPAMLRWPRFSPASAARAVELPRSGRQGRESWRVKVPLPSIARFGRLAYPLLGEVTNRDMRGCKSHGCPWCGNHTKRWERPGWRANPGA